MRRDTVAPAPELKPGMHVDLVDERAKSTWKTEIVSVLDVGIVVTTEDGQGLPNLQTNAHIKLQIALGAGRIQEASGMVVGASEAGMAIKIATAFRALERRAFPRIEACVPMRYRALDGVNERRVASAIRSRVVARRSTRSTEPPPDRGEMAAVIFRLQKIERALELLTDLVMWAGSGQSPLAERHLSLSANGLSFEPDDASELPKGTAVELEILLPLRDPVRVRATGEVVRHGTELGKKAVALQFKVIDESDRDEIARYVFQIQRTRQAKLIRTDSRVA